MAEVIVCEVASGGLWVKSSAALQLSLMGANLYAIHRSTGAIWNCTIAINASGNAVGGCLQVSTLANLQ